jgi:hypothetical protein
MKKRTDVRERTVLHRRVKGVAVAYFFYAARKSGAEGAKISVLKSHFHHRTIAHRTIASHARSITSSETPSTEK